MEHWGSLKLEVREREMSAESGPWIVFSLEDLSIMCSISVRRFL